MDWKDKRQRAHKKALAISYAYDRFMEKQGFYIVLALCVLTIVLTAIFTNKNHTVIAQPPVYEGLMAAAEDETVQRLKDVATPAPTQPPAVFVFPLSDFKAVYRAFDGARPAYFEHSGHWQLHRGIDIYADYGQSVLAIADGKVKTIEKGGSDGIAITLSHLNGYESCYKGLLSLSGIEAGDPVKSGQVIAYAGYGPLLENEDGAHIHLEIKKEDILLNPADLFQ